MTLGGRAVQARLGPDIKRLPIRELEPHLVLAGSAIVVLLAQFLAVKQGSSAWIVISALVSAGAFVIVWQLQDQLRLAPLLALTLAFQLAWVGLDLQLGVHSIDSSGLYRIWGNALLHGHYPDAQYPPGAVLLFAFDAFVGGGPTRLSNAFVMIPFQVVAVTAVWAMRTRVSAWLAAFVALWPLDAFFWAFRFDLFPTALLAVGLVFALRERWLLSGALLGLGAAAKWTPALAFVVLAVWLLSGRRWGPWRALVLAFGVVFLLLHLPLMIWSPDHVVYSYRYFNSQGVTGESIWYLVLAPLGQATVSMHAFWLPAHVPGWTNSMTAIVQAASLLALCTAVWRARASARAAVAIAAMAPVVFLLLNRVFSPQYLVLMVVAWAIAGASVLDDRRDQLALGLAMMVATTANALVYPYTLFQLNLWRLASAVLFIVGLTISACIVVRALQAAGRPRDGWDGSPVAPPDQHSVSARA